MKLKEGVVREARVKKRFSQEEIAYFMNISQSQYSKLENGEASFEISKLSILLDKLDLNPLEALEFTDQQQVFINSAMSGNHNNSNSFNNYDILAIREIVQEELNKTRKN